MWISVEDELPEGGNYGVHDAFPVLVMTSEPYGETTHWNVKVCTWMQNRFQGYPAGARKVTHWMLIPPLPEEE